MVSGFNRLIAICFAVMWLLVSAPVHALTTDWQAWDEVKTRLVTGDVVRDDGTRWVGIEFELEGNWKTYWRSSGDSGSPIDPDFSPSGNLKDAAIHWPAPTRYVDYDIIESYGYKHHVVIPVAVTPQDPAAPIDLNVPLKFAVCDEVCYFFDHTFELSVTPDAESHQRIITPYINRIPAVGSTPELAIIGAGIESDSVVITARSAHGFDKKADVLVEAGPDFRFPKPTVKVKGNTATFRYNYEQLLDSADLSATKTILTFVNGDHAMETPITFNVPMPAVNTDPIGLLTILLFAVLGGLILNIMPCVLPVLSIKVMGVLKKSRAELPSVRLGFIWTALGIWTSFLVLASIILSLKAGGTAVGWGFHFQEPLFIIAVVLVINLFAASEFGLFEFRLPRWLGGSVDSTLDKSDHSSPFGHFLTGAFATLLATPCSAPFLGTAVSFALSRGPAEIVVIFLAMGLGLSLPYLLFAMFPGAVRVLPKPGDWMRTVQKILGTLLVGTSIWLIWVLSNQISLVNTIVLTALSLMPVVLFWKFNHRSTFSKCMYMALIFALIAFAPRTPQMEEHEMNDKWVEFDELAIEEHVANGKVVFVDVTADWCVTCKWNKINVMKRGEVAKQLCGDDVIAMRADYTNPSEYIRAFLEKNGRYGIPFNIVYGPSAPEGIPLSELLTEHAVLDALRDAR